MRLDFGRRRRPARRPGPRGPDLARGLAITWRAASYEPGDRDAHIAGLVADLQRRLGDRSADVVGTWAKYDQLKIKRVLSYIPYEAWLALLKTSSSSSNRSD
ncbi:hypothetical protein H4R18_005283 [Coemansia javaensis]|uniref:Uncharacterized protein n=1 Tax=Coemansia javaensis TaxID=2761396 RepID=A0A9W8H314_9FUNG|nr:hypothetical protein H4R18_005283 [Coemansia javaensis]